MIARTDGHGGGDDPYFVGRMHDWIRDGDTAFHIYFDVGTPSTTSSMTKGWFPEGAARFRDLFGPARPPVSPQAGAAPFAEADDGIAPVADEPRRAPRVRPSCVESGIDGASPCRSGDPSP
jgi:hypothetical protein